MFCENCKAKIPTIKTRLSQVNQRLAVISYQFYEFQNDAMSLIYAALKANGFTEYENVQFNHGELHQHVGEGKYLTVTVYRFETGRYEVTAYVN